MKIGIAISTLIVLMFVGLFVVNSMGYPDRATTATSADKLAKAVLPADLPAIQPPAKPDATANYREAIDLFLARPQTFAEPPFPARAVDPIVELILKATEAGTVEAGFLEGYLKMDYHRTGAADSVTFDLGQMLLQHAQHLAQSEATRGRAQDITRAVFVFGERAFRHSTRLANRYAGLVLIQAAGAQLFELLEEPTETNDALFAWDDAVRDVVKRWQDKTGIVRSTKPHPSDLIRIAEQDQDRTFRIAATYWLGVAKYTSAGKRGNRRAILAAIASAKSSDDPLIAQAGEAADALTLEQFRQIH